MSTMRRSVTSNEIGHLAFSLLSGTTGPSEGDVTAVPHGLSWDRIVGFLSSIEATGLKVTQAHVATAGFEYSAKATLTDIEIRLDTNGSENIRSKPFEILVFYRR